MENSSSTSNSSGHIQEAQETQETTLNTGEELRPPTSPENEGTEGDGGNSEDDQPNLPETRSEAEAETDQGGYTPIHETAYSPVQEGEVSPASLPPMHFHDQDLQATLRDHGRFVKHLADALTASTVDHSSTIQHVARSLSGLQRLTLRRLHRYGDGPRYLSDYFEPDIENPREMRRRRRPPPAREPNEAAQETSCGPDCSG